MEEMDTSNNTGNEGFSAIRAIFTNGDPIINDGSEIKFKMRRSDDDPNVINKIVFKNDKIRYEGKPDQSELVNNFLAIRNKTTGKVRWVPVNDYLVKPYVKRDFELNNEATMPGDKQPESFKEAMDNLNRVMGSKISKAKLAEGNKYNIKSKNITKSIQNAIETNEIKLVENPEEELNSYDKYLPPYNPAAVIPQEVYAVNDVLPPHVSSSLDDISTEVIVMINNANHASKISKRKVSDTEKMESFQHLNTDKRFNEFVYMNIIHLKKRDSLKIKLILYADALFSFANAPPREIQSNNASFSTFSPVLNQAILENFCTIGANRVRTRDPAMREKAICYALISLVLANNFVYNINLLNNKIHPKLLSRMPVYMRLIGTTKARGNGTLYQLKLPLAKPPVGQRNQKRR